MGDGAKASAVTSQVMDSCSMIIKNLKLEDEPQSAALSLARVSSNSFVRDGLAYQLQIGWHFIAKF
jgi:hypothetical protein